MKMLLDILVSKSEGARYSDVNEVMHIGTQRVYILCCLKWWMLLYKMHSIVNGTWLSVLVCFCFANNDQGAGYRV